MRRSAFGHVLVLLTAFGCNEIAGIKDPVNGDAVDGGGGGGGGEVTAFLGTWSTTDTTHVLGNCADMGTSSNQAGSITIEKGTSSDILMLIGGGCPINASVSGSTASLLAGQGCTGTIGMTGVKQTYLYQASTFTLAASGKQASAHFTGLVQFETTAGEMETCTFDDVGTFTKP
ncbi:MAG TPA: hypothetical protein VLT33_45235 [Labilithrix sp.]|nr:hypothetical protein [Labilithrix sp.]